MKPSIRALLLASLSLAPLGSWAAAITDCPVTATVCYQYDDSQAALALLGAPTRVGDDMRFMPWDFWALSEDGAGPSTSNTTFVFDRVWTPSGAGILSLLVAEEGDYEIVGNGLVSAQLGLTISSNVLLTDTIAATPLFTASADSGGMDLWSLSASGYPVASFTGPANDVKVSIANTLTASEAISCPPVVQTRSKMKLAGPAVANPVPLDRARKLAGKNCMSSPTRVGKPVQATAVWALS